MTYARARKTVPVQPLLDYANNFLAAKGGTPEARKAVIGFIESVLFKADRYRGFTYLTQDQLDADDLPGIRWIERVPGMVGDPCFEKSDDTRRNYK
jgi:hypothetical protein